MISNERRWPSQRQPQPQAQRQPYYDRYQAAPRAPLREDTLKTLEIQVERKHFLLLLKENPRGRFLRISEDVGGRINSIIIPIDGLGQFQKLLGEMLAAAEQLPPLKSPPEQATPPEQA
jgi:hypothetical protein